MASLLARFIFDEVAIWQWTSNVLAGQIFAQKIVTKVGTAQWLLHWGIINTQLYSRESNVLLKFFKVLHHNFIVCLYTGYTEVGYII